MKVHQICARTEYGDAVSNHALTIADQLSEWGYENYIYADSISPELSGQIKKSSDYRQWLNTSSDLLIFHYSLFSPNYKHYLKSKNKKIFIYHNITPANFFYPWNSEISKICSKGRSLLPKLTNCDLALGDSQFNLNELIENGFNKAKTGVLPIFIDFNKLVEQPLNQKLIEKYNDDSRNILFVGRRVPNKRIEEVIKIFIYYNRCVNVKSRLFLVGTPWLDSYEKKLNQLALNSGVSENIIFTNKVSIQDLVTYYNISNLFLIMSEHEGFCVPLIESMLFRLPIIAYNSSAVPETLDGTGILVNSKKPDKIAEFIGKIMENSQFTEKIIKKQSVRLNHFLTNNVRNILHNHLAPFLQ